MEMTAADEFVDLDATSQSELVRNGDVKPIELVEAAIERIERVNPEINAVITPMYDLAREAARGVLPQGPFTGVPFLLKDIFASYAGVPLTFGSRFLRDYVPDHDSELVVRLKRAGLITLGKTNCPEFGLLPTTEPLFFGPCRNPWDTTRSTGGSSGGAAAAVASGMVTMAHANDIGGSIRIPASCCGVFGLKPTRARNPLGPELGDVCEGMVAEHAVTRSVRDSAALLDATSGPDVGDPYWAPKPERPFLSEVGADPGRLRIAVLKELRGGGEVHQDCIKAVEEVSKLCADLGHELDVDFELDLDFSDIIQVFSVLYASACAWTVDSCALLVGKKPTAEEFEPLTWDLRDTGCNTTAPAFMLAVTAMQGFARAIMRSFAEYDVVLTPTITEPPPPLGSYDSPPDFPLAGLFRASTVVTFTTIGNYTGLPAMSVPLCWNDDSLPIGTMFFGRFGDEATLFRLAAQLEEARPWADRKPPVSA
jgi:amidase